MRVLLLASVFSLLLIIGSTFFACVPYIEPTSFSIQVIPEHITDAIYGQRCIFLVVVTDEGEGISKGKAVNISAKAPGATVTVHPQAITHGQVAEVTVIPGEVIIGEALTSPEPVTQRPPIEPIEPVEPDKPETLTVTITGEREGLEQTESVTIEVRQGEDLLAPTATEMRDRFIPWLAANHPELGITSETEWAESIVRPHILVVMYYLFFSKDWEMGVRWHVMIPPHDWAEIYLRHRFTDLHPSYAFKISSLDAQEEPQAVDLPESVWR